MPTKSLATLPLLLRIHGLLDNIDNNVFNQCMHEIILQLFGGNKPMLKFIIKSANKTELTSIHNIIKQQTVSHQNKTKNNEINNEKPDEIPSNTITSLPNDCIHHICDYLHSWSVRCFKNTSRQFAIVCLEQMSKITISIMISNQLKNNNFKSHCEHMQNRHNSSTQFYVLQEQWHETYGIPEQNQLIFKMRGKYSLSKRSLFPQPINVAKWRLSKVKNVKNATYLICDNRNVVILDINKVRKFDMKNDTYKKIRQYTLMILEYFDVRKQTSTIVQFILYKSSQITFKRLMKYIQYEFVQFDDINNEWYDELSNYLRQTNEFQNIEKLQVYEQATVERELKEYTDDEVLDESLYTFQINLKHTHCLQAVKYDEIYRYWYKKKTIAEPCALMLYSNTKKIQIDIMNSSMLQSCFDNYFNRKFTEMERQVFKTDFKALYCNWRQCFVLNIEINITSPIQWLKSKICQAFDNIFMPHNIELCSNRGLLTDNQQIRLANTVLQYFKVTCWLVFHDTTKPLATGDQSCIINIFKPMQCPFPYRQSISTKIMVRYNQDWKFKDLLNHLFELIYKGSDNILYDEYKNLLDLYYGHNAEVESDDDCNMNQTDDVMTPVLAGRIDFIFSTISYRHQSTVDGLVFELDEQILRKKINHLNLFMIRIAPDLSHLSMKNVRLNIAFINDEVNDTKNVLTKWTPRNEINKLQFVGFPLIAWITPNDTLQKIIDQYMKPKSWWEKLFCYRITDDKVISIPKNKWKDYRPYWQFLWNSPNDFLIFKSKFNSAAVLSTKLQNKYLISNCKTLPKS